MGGKVFSSGGDPLFTPRLAREAYKQVRESCLAALRPLFPLVGTPVEAPQKTTFGDVDILACIEGSPLAAADQGTQAASYDAIWSAVEAALQPRRTNQETPLAKNFAVPWPLEMSALAMEMQLDVEREVVGGGEAGSCGDEAVVSGRKADTCREAEARPRFVQVDVHLCGTKHEYEWALFKLAHGDLWNILGTIHRPHGLTISDKALHIRIPEIEDYDKKRARVFLTDHPAEVLDFLGLSIRNHEWERPFASVDDLFEYAAQCRWFILAPHNDDEENIAQDEAAAARRKLKHNDRQRMRQRPIFARWLDEFVPACRAAGRFVATDGHNPSLRKEVRDAAFTTFSNAKTAYHARLEEWRDERARLYVKNTLIRSGACLPDVESVARVVPAPQEGSTAEAGDIAVSWRGVLRSALTRILVERDYLWLEDVPGTVLTEPPPPLRDQSGAVTEEELRAWVAGNWSVVGRAAWRENCARAAEAFRIREERREKDAGEGEKSAPGAGIGAGQTMSENLGDLA